MISKKKNPGLFVLILLFPTYSFFSKATQAAPLLQTSSSFTIHQKGGLRKSKESDIFIDDIIIRTKNLKLQSSITKALFKYKNKVFSKKLSDEIYNKILLLLKEKKILLPEITEPLFRFSDNKLIISYTINNPYRYGFIIKGNTALDRYSLLSKKKYEKYFNNSQLVRRILSQIKESYLKRGYTNVRLKHEVHQDDKYFIKTVFILVEENKRTKIKKIQLFGQFSRSWPYYIDFISNYSGPLIRKKLFYNMDIQKGVKNLVNSLKNEGYLQANAHIRVTNIADNAVIVDLILNEGPLTRVKSINFKGNKYFSHQQLTRLMKIKINEGLNIHYLEQDIETLINTYRNAGFIEMELSNKEEVVEYDKKTSYAVLQFNIIEKAKVRIDNIVVRGNQLTNRDFIINNLPLKEGDILTPEKIAFSIRKLRNLGIFSRIEILTEEEDKSAEERTLFIQVEERKPKSVRFALGVNTERTLTARGFAEFVNRNIMGTGRRFFSNIKLQSNIAKYAQLDSLAPEYLEHQVSVSYIEPFFLRSGFDGHINISNSAQIFSHTYTAQEGNITDIVDSINVNFLLKRTIDNFITLTWKLLSWEGRTQSKKMEICNTNNPPSPLCDSDTLNISTTGISLQIDKRNNILSTSDGFLSQMFMEYSGPFYVVPASKEIQFMKLEVKHFDFRSIFNNWVWANSVQGGFIANMNSLEQGGFPVSRAFILGGVNSLR
ncbi:MAG: BamA/TamA family outer membrane protein, partial [Bdellovibrionales bacterium]|nr:BamA/TamA family outer membrane protein [Bdellovibrionales bacterium]